jgi:hypothetical protein
MFYLVFQCLDALLRQSDPFAVEGEIRHFRAVVKSVHRNFF